MNTFFGKIKCEFMSPSTQQKNGKVEWVFAIIY